MCTFPPFFTVMSSQGRTALNLMEKGYLCRNDFYFVLKPREDERNHLPGNFLTPTLQSIFILELKVNFQNFPVMEWLIRRILIKIIDHVYWVVRIVLHYLLALANWSRYRKIPPIRDPILQMSATELAKQIREGTLTSECVVRTFTDRILEVEPYINATVERRFNDALQEAREADALVASGTLSRQQLAVEKPLLGVPFTVKVLITVKGMKSTASSCLFLDTRAYEDSTSVAQMKKAGAIVIATTNSSEFGLNFETNNYAHGTTCNPYDTCRTSGGSSGGESAILAAAGSVIGLGNDLAGSIRVPCFFCGLFGHKPSRGLVAVDGCFPTPPDDLLDMLFNGPMCRYATDLVTTMKILANPNAPSPKFDQKVDFEDLTIYYMFSFGDMPFVMKVDPEIKNIIQKVVSYFETKHDSKTKLLNLPLLKCSNSIYFHKLISGAQDISEVITCGKTKVDGTVELIKMILRQSKFTVGTVVAMNAHSIPLVYNANKLDHFKKLHAELEKQFNDILNEKSILILPTLPFAAPYHYEMSLLLASTCYTSVFNLLGLPVTQCPVGLNKSGLPIGLQIVSRMGNDHLTMACAIELEKAFGGWIPPS